MKSDNISIKWKLFRYLAIFTAVMLAFLWFFQIVFLDSFYKIMKIQSIRASAHGIVENIENSDLQNLIDKIAQQNEISIRILDENFTDLYSTVATSD